MIFAHGPIGFLTALAAKPWWRKWTSDGIAAGWMLALGYLGGIFPDIDLFYISYVNASLSHRDLITHTPALYIAVGAVVGAVLALIKKQTAAVAVAIFCAGALTHMVADLIVGQIKLFYPFSGRFFGLTDLRIEWLNENILFANFLLEGIFITAFFYALIVFFTKTKTSRITWTGLLLVVFAAGLLTLITGNNHVYRNGESNAYGDDDADGIANINDTDMDNDGTLNIADIDSDNDGKGNTEEIIEHSARFFNVWVDPTNGGIAQVPIRLGLTSNNDITRQLYSAVGIYIRTELQEDYNSNPNGYVLTPKDKNFDRSKEVLRTWLEHRNSLETGEAMLQGRNQIGDILFFTSNHVGIVTGFNNSGQPQVLDVHTDRVAQERSVEELIQLEGDVQARGKILDSTPLNTPTP